jgi:hypothetical protein
VYAYVLEFLKACLIPFVLHAVCVGACNIVRVARIMLSMSETTLSDALPDYARRQAGCAEMQGLCHPSRAHFSLSTDKRCISQHGRIGDG